MTDRDNRSEMIKLPDVLDLSNVSILKSILVEQLEKMDPPTFDCSSVTRMTTPAVQLMLAYAKALGADGKHLSIASPSETFCSAFADLGLQDELFAWGTK